MRLTRPHRFGVNRDIRTRREVVTAPNCRRLKKKSVYAFLLWWHYERMTRWRDRITRRPTSVTSQPHVIVTVIIIERPPRLQIRAKRWLSPPTFCSRRSTIFWQRWSCFDWFSTVLSSKPPPSEIIIKKRGRFTLNKYLEFNMQMYIFFFSYRESIILCFTGCKIEFFILYISCERRCKMFFQLASHTSLSVHACCTNILHTRTYIYIYKIYYFTLRLILYCNVLHSTFWIK